MKLKMFLVTCCCLFQVLFSHASAERPNVESDADEPVNILFLFTDDHATQALSAYGGMLKEIAPTPNLDRIARDGMLFTRCYVTNSLCGPSRAVIQTGKYSHLNGFRKNGDRFDGSQQTAPKLLQSGGYQTAIIGKWHLASTPTGFDHYEILKGQGSYYNPLFLTSNGNVMREGYTTDLITDRTIVWLKNRDQDKPFFLMAQHKAPHGRWEPALRHLGLFDDVEIPEPATLFDDYANRSPAPAGHAMGILKEMNDHRLMIDYSSKHTPDQLEQFDSYFRPRNEAFLRIRDNLSDEERTHWHYQRFIKNYLRCVRAVDESVGTILSYLDEAGLSENTVVIYSSDQGFYLGEHGWFDKRWMYEESLRTPLLVRWPGVVKKGSINEEDIVSNLDFAETFLDIAGLEIPDDMQGRSLVPVLKGETPEDWRKSFYYHYYEKGGHGVPLHDGVTDGRYKLIHFYDLKPEAWELFDLQQDPLELRSVYDNSEYAQVRARLETELNRLRKQYEVD